MAKKLPAKPAPTPITIPDSPEAVAKLYRAMTDESHRTELVHQVLAEQQAADADATLSKPQRTKIRASTTSRLLAIASLAKLCEWEWPDTPSDQDRAWNWLRTNAADSFEPVLLQHVKSGDAGLKRASYQCLAWMARTSSLPVLEQAIKGRDFLICGSIAEGAGLASLHNEGSSAFYSAVFRALSPCVTGEYKLTGADDDAEFAQEQIVDGLWRLDPEAGLALLSSPKCLHTRNRLLREVLIAIRHANPDYELFQAPKRLIKGELQEMKTPYTPPDQTLLWSLYEALQVKFAKDPSNWPVTHTLIVILELSAASDPARTQVEAKKLAKLLGKDGGSGPDLIRDVLKACKQIPKLSKLVDVLDDEPAALPENLAGIVRAFELANQLVDESLPVAILNCRDIIGLACTGARELDLAPAAKQIESAAALLGLKVKVARVTGKAPEYEDIKPGVLDKLDAIEKSLSKLAPRIIKAAEQFVEKHAEEFKKSL